MLFETSSTHRSLRSSLYPFIRNPTDLNDDQSYFAQAEDSHKRQQFKFLQRYHDESFIVKSTKLNHVQQYARLLNGITRVFKPKNNKLDPKAIPRDRYEGNLTFSPQSLGLYIWNLLIAVSILYHFFQIPIVLFFTEKAFNSQFQSVFGLTCNIVSLMMLFINIVYVIPNTQYYHNGFLVSSQQKIIQRYLGWRLALDSIGYLSALIFVVINSYQLMYLKLGFYLMIDRLVQVDEMLQRKVELTKVRLACYKLWRIIILLLFLVVWLASIFFAMDYHYYQQGASARYTGSQLWLVDTEATNYIDIIQFYDDWWVWFDYAMYWCFQTVTMVGFGDITGKNPIEVTYTSLIITLVVVSYAFFITGVWEIVAEAREFSEYQNRQWRKYKEYQKGNMRPLNRKTQPSEKGSLYRQLKNKVGSYLFEMWNHDKTYSEINIVEVLEKSLTPELKDEVFINYRQHLFQRVQLFRELEEMQPKHYKYVFRELIFKIAEVKYAKDQVLVRAGDLSPSLIYLVKGKLTLEYPHSNYRRTLEHSFSDLKETDHPNFAVKQFFTQQPMPYSVRCESFCKTSELSLESFLNSIRGVEQFYIKYCQLRDQLKFYNKDKLTGEQCVECGSNEHDLDRCEECDIGMYYKQLWMKIRMRKKGDREQKKEKCQKMPFKRRNVKSKKIVNLSARVGRQVRIEKVRQFKTYYPQYNLSTI